MLSTEGISPMATVTVSRRTEQIREDFRLARLTNAVAGSLGDLNTVGLGLAGTEVDVICWVTAAVRS